MALKRDLKGITDDFLELVKSEVIGAFLCDKNCILECSTDLLISLANGRLRYFLDEIKVDRIKSRKVSEEDLSSIFAFCEFYHFDPYYGEPAPLDLFLSELLCLVNYSISTARGLNKKRDDKTAQQLQKYYNNTKNLIETQYLKEKIKDADKTRARLKMLYCFCFELSSNEQLEQIETIEKIFNFKFQIKNGEIEPFTFQQILGKDLTKYDFEYVLRLFDVLKSTQGQLWSYQNPRDEYEAINRLLRGLNEFFELGIKELIDSNEFNVAVREGLNEYLKKSKKD
ncbi:MAG: hypothetical protein HXK63_00950 [Campylobacter sp.]|nr:hypothetical protein [Campylobacter sp.]